LRFLRILNVREFRVARGAVSDRQTADSARSNLPSRRTGRVVADLHSLAVFIR
jgi:hypothetical protein